MHNCDFTGALLRREHQEHLPSLSPWSAEEIDLLKIFALGILIFFGDVELLPRPVAGFHRHVAHRVPPIDGSYVARTMNGRPLPADLRIPVTEGDVRLFRLEQGVLTLGSNGRFTLHFRYYHQLVRRGARPTRTPVMSDSEAGTYSFNRGQLILTPEKKKRGPSRPNITASIAGEVVKASYLLHDAVANERIALVLCRDASYW